MAGILTKFSYAAAVVTRDGTARALTATADEWADPDRQQAVVALRPYGWHDPVLYVIPRDGVGDYEMHRVSGSGMMPRSDAGVLLERALVWSVWAFLGLIDPRHHNYDLLRCYLSGISMNKICFAPPDMPDYRDGRGGAIQ